ncbi:iron uptake transporter deferrochelatase/peroxidase subunit [Glutamicibacter ectropisis]|uniref:Deferrochelatase n=1 Tax=Glutamicibacter ectropisis TaxID=3046593 RepID=A0AAU6WI35_9MICC
MHEESAESESPKGTTLNRRLLLSAMGAGGAGLALGALGHSAYASQKSQQVPDDQVPFYGEHQSGIITEAQDRMHTAAFDVQAQSRDELIELLQTWTQAIAQMMQGQPIGTSGAVDGSYDAPPEDTGEALGLPASRLTVTVGFGRTLFEKDGKTRFGLDGKLPEALIELPHFRSDMIEEARSNGDIIVQACADDPQVAVHAIRNLARLAFGKANVRWSQIGFGRTSKTSSAQSTPRNLFGFKDGTDNIVAEHTDDLNAHVWVQKEQTDQAWMAGGSYMVIRRIRMHIETWDRATLGEQENLVGRLKGSGAPLSGGEEFTAPDFNMAGSNGPIIPVDSHIAVVHPDAHKGIRMLRRGFNYTDGSDGLGRLDAGLFFIAFVTDARTHFVPIQQAMSANDAMTEYLRNTSSGLYAIVPGVREGQYLGQQLFES